ncbi:MAG: HAD-IA family hydrolase [Planctomycetota bacterium]|nr:HAD-IA family hydrolase [Planctomycetota bacterium]
MFRQCKAVLFDAVGTLIYPQPPVAQAYYQAGRQFGSKLTIESIEDRFRKAFFKQDQADQLKYEGTVSRQSESMANQKRPDPATKEHTISVERHPTSHVREQDRWRNIIREIFDDVQQPEGDLFSCLWSHFGDSRNWSLYDDVKATWQHLAASEIRLGIASNFDNRLLKICRDLRPLDQAQEVFCSSEVGFPKPSPRFFQEVASRMQLHPSEILMVGDDRENDLTGPLAAGWQGLHLNRAAMGTDANTITSLEDLLVLLAPN